MFKVGDEVVCVNDQPIDHDLAWTAVGLVSGKTYIVSGWIFHPISGAPHILVDGATNICNALCVEIGFRPIRFRKVQRRDIGEWLKTSVGNTSKWDKTRKVSA